MISERDEEICGGLKGLLKQLWFTNTDSFFLVFTFSLCQVILISHFSDYRNGHKFFFVLFAIWLWRPFLSRGGVCFPDSCMQVWPCDSFGQLGIGKHVIGACCFLEPQTDLDERSHGAESNYPIWGSQLQTCNWGHTRLRLHKVTAVLILDPLKSMSETHIWQLYFCWVS